MPSRHVHIRPALKSALKIALSLNFQFEQNLLLLLLIFKDSPTGKGTLIEGVSVERWNYMLL